MLLGVFFVLGIHRNHPSRTWMSESFSSWDGMHVCTDYTSVYTLIWRSFGGMVSVPTLTPREKSPLLAAQRRTEPMTLHHAWQRAQHTTDWAIPAPISPFRMHTLACLACKQWYGTRIWTETAKIMVHKTGPSKHNKANLIWHMVYAKNNTIYNDVWYN